MNLIHWLKWGVNKVKNILFVCKHNRFRSKVAEAFFNKFNKNKSYVASSAGLIPGGYPLDDLQVKVAKEFGIKFKGKPQAITTDLLRWMNLMIIVADNVPREIFKNKKYGREELVWNIKDDDGSGAEETYKVIKKIENKVKYFVRTL